MPERCGFLYEKIYSWQNLVSAFRQARRSKRAKSEVAEFEFNLEKELDSIQEDLKNKQYRFSGYKFFIIREPKERLIACASFRDRVVHHAICNIVEPVLEKSMIPDTYACRTGKGLHHAVQRAYYFYRNSRYVYKFDIQKYFHTIDHEILINKLNRKIKDPDLIVLLGQLLHTYHSGDEYYLQFPGDTEYEIKRERGLPIGNLTSQIFANYYLCSFDHFIKDTKCSRNYLRYMDDMLLFSNNKYELDNTRAEAAEHLQNLRLHIHPDKNRIFQTKYGLNFLGFRLINNRIRLQNRNLVRFKRKLKGFSEKEVSLDKILLSFNGHLGYFNSGHCRKIVSRVLKEYEFRVGSRSFKLAI